MASASSTFTGTENPLSEGGAWATPSAFWGSLRKANGAGVAAVNTESGMRYVAATFTANQFSQIVLASVPAGAQLYFQYVNVRMNATAGLYQVATSSETGPNILQLYVVSDAGAFTQIGADITTPSNLAAGNVVRLEVVGTTLTVKVDQGSGLTTLRTATDSTFSTGQPGLGGWAQSGSDVLFTTSWSAGDVGGPPPFTGRTPSYMFSI